MPATAQELLTFLNQATSPYHAVRTVAERLRCAGYAELDERQRWELVPGQQVFVQRAGGSIVAIQIGRKPPSETGYLIIGAHTDSPNLRIKPNFELRGNKAFGLAVEPYGGLLLHSWLDRPLALAGRIVFSSGESALIDIPRGLFTIPSLAIHLQRDVNTQGLILNPQQHLRPILGLDFDSNAPHPLAAILSEAINRQNASSDQNKSTASELCPSIDPLHLAAFDLCLLDATTAGFLGNDEAYVQGGRLDNLVSAYAGLEALLDAGAPAEATRVLVLYDHEEVGSRSFAGAQSTLLGDVLTRIATRIAPVDDAGYRAMAQSLLLSADMAHAVHPNFPDKHDDLHRPVLGGGPVLKSNAGQSYATDSVSAAAIFSAAARAGIELQRFVTRNDMPCGSTIGPLAAARQGIRTVDVGAPMLGMHSARELCATSDVAPYTRLMTEWYKTVPAHCPSR